MVDVAGVFDALERVGYRGFVTIEQDRFPVPAHRSMTFDRAWQ